MDAEDVVAWCKDKINSSHAVITRKGKNWYINVDDFVITVNAHSYTIITAHREKENPWYSVENAAVTGHGVSSNVSGFPTIYNRVE